MEKLPARFMRFRMLAGGGVLLHGSGSGGGQDPGS